MGEGGQGGKSSNAGQVNWEFCLPGDSGDDIGDEVDYIFFVFLGKGVLDNSGLRMRSRGLGISKAAGGGLLRQMLAGLLEGGAPFIEGSMRLATVCTLWVFFGDGALLELMATTTPKALGGFVAVTRCVAEALTVEALRDLRGINVGFHAMESVPEAHPIAEQGFF